MDVDTPAVRRLRDALAELGQRPSLMPPGPDARGLPGADQPELQAAVERVAPICELLFLVMAADGVCDVREHEALLGVFRMLSDGALRAATLDGMLELFGERLAAQGRPARIAQVAAELSADPVDADAALAAAAAVVMSDGEITPDEQDMLEELAEWLGLGSKRLAAILG